MVVRFQMVIMIETPLSTTAVEKMGTPQIPSFFPLTPHSSCWNLTLTCASMCEEWRLEVSGSIGIVKIPDLQMELVGSHHARTWAQMSESIIVIIIVD